MKNFVIGAIAVVALILGLIGFQKDLPLGSTPGVDHLNLEYFYGGLAQGGGVKAITATNTSAGVNLTSKDLCENSVITIALGRGATTTLPAGSTINNTCLNKAGMFKDVIFYNANALAASSTFVVATSGFPLWYASGTVAQLG